VKTQNQPSTTGVFVEGRSLLLGTQKLVDFVTVKKSVGKLLKSNKIFFTLILI
jgi:hypothetical protein